MRTLIVLESHWGNTGDIAHAIAEGLAGSGRVDVVNVDDAPTELAGVDLLLVGGPTHAFTMSRPASRHDARMRGATSTTSRGIREWLALVEDAAIDGQVAQFDTRVASLKALPGSAAAAAARVGPGVSGRAAARPSA